MLEIGPQLHSAIETVSVSIMFCVIVYYVTKFFREL